MAAEWLVLVLGVLMAQMLQDERLSVQKPAVSQNQDVSPIVPGTYTHSFVPPIFASHQLQLLAQFVVLYGKMLNLAVGR